MRIEGKKVVITGASSGLGEALARELADRGAQLTLTSRRLDRLQTVAREIAATAPGVPTPLPVRCDVANRADVHALISTAASHMGGVDLLINNAALSVYGDTERTSETEFQMLLAVNFLGPVYGMLETLPIMRRQGNGFIVNIASLAALHGVPYLSAYGASKAALASVSQSLRAELSQTSIKILVVYPGYTETPLFEHERKVGGARRPQGPYRSVNPVARSVLRAIETEKQELVLTPEGKTMVLLRGLLPRGIQLVMNRVATRLREKGGISHA
jgi:short-subunit dehydrogenase